MAAAGLGVCISRRVEITGEEIRHPRSSSSHRNYFYAGDHQETVSFYNKQGGLGVGVSRATLLPWRCCRS